MLGLKASVAFELGGGGEVIDVLRGLHDAVKRIIVARFMPFFPELPTERDLGPDDEIVSIS